MTPPTLSEEMIEEILLRLPVRCLLRFKCVCKSWFSLISSYEFAKSHFDLAATPTHRLFLVKFSKVHPKLNATDIDGPLDLDSTKVVFNLPSLPQPTTLYKRIIDTMGSCNGFILLQIKTVRLDGEFLIWNPSTGFRKRIVHEFNHIIAPKHLCGIGYNSSIDDYVVVIVTFSQPPRSNIWKYPKVRVHCFSSRTNSWSCVEHSFRTNSWSGPTFNHGVFLNGTIHWFDESYHEYGTIIAFDVMEKKLLEIPLPHGLDSKSYHLRAMGECLCLCFVGSQSELPEMWIMKEYKVQSSWTKSIVVSPFYHNYFFFKFLPIYFTKNGEVLGSDCDTTLARLDDKGEVLEEYTHWHGTNRRILFGLHHYGVYRESLLSLPGKFEEASDPTCIMYDLIP